MMVTVADRLGYAAAFVISPVAVALVGIAVERVFFRKFYRLDPALILLLTFGLAMVIAQHLRLIFGATPWPFAIPEFLRRTIIIGGFLYSRYSFTVVALA